MTHGKKYRASIEKYDRAESYPLEKAVDLVKELAYAKFDETVEVSMKLNIKSKHTIRDVMALPHLFGKEKQILVFAKGDKAEEARKAGAAFVGDNDLIDKIKGGWLDFDVAVATPDMMKDVGKLGQILGRRGLMPNPKTQTVTFNIKEALEELKKGRVGIARTRAASSISRLPSSPWAKKRSRPTPRLSSRRWCARGLPI